jgi:predicted ester cyclase
MSAEANKALVQRYWDEVWNQGKLDLIPELFPPELIEGQQFFVSRTLAAFSESVVTIEKLLAVGDVVIARYRWSATHTGVWDMTLADVPMNVPATGKRVWDAGIAISQIAAGKIVRNDPEWTKLELALQIGAVRGTLG